MKKKIKRGGKRTITKRAGTFRMCISVSDKKYITKIEKLANINGVSKSQIVRDALERYL